jgi:hypothetical protein
MNRTVIMLLLLVESAFGLAAQDTAAYNFKQITNAEQAMMRAAAKTWCNDLHCCRDAHEALLAYFYTALHVATVQLAYNEVKANIMRRCKQLDTFAGDERKQEMKALAYDCALIKTISPSKSKHEEALKRIEAHLEGCDDLETILESLRDTLFNLMATCLERRAHELDALLLNAGDVMADEIVSDLANACHTLAQYRSDASETASLMKLNMLNNLLKPLNIKLDEFTAATDALTQAVNVTLVIGRAYFIDAYNALSERYQTVYGQAPHCSFAGEQSVQELPDRL